MAAIPDTGGARHAPCAVMRALLRLVVLGGLIATGWLLGSGASHADEDLGQPGPNPFHLVNSASADDLSGDRFGVSPPVGPIVNKVLSTTSVPRLSDQPPVQVGLPKPVKPLAKAVGGAKPLTKILTPVVRPLPGSGADRAAAQSPAQVKRSAAVPLGTPAESAPADVAPTRTPAVTELTPASPAVRVDAQRWQASGSRTKISPAEVDTVPGLAPTVTSDAPVAPIPARAPGSTTSPCTIGGSGGGTSTKNTSDVAVRENWAAASLLQRRGLHSCDTSDLPRSLSAQPSTSPD